MRKREKKWLMAAGGETGVCLVLQGLNRHILYTNSNHTATYTTEDGDGQIAV
jgi:hypothetical protein